MRVGILGGGQLARMLALEGHRMGLQPHVFCARPDDPAAQVCANTGIGRLEDQNAIRKFSEQVDVLTIESEFLNTSLVGAAIGEKSLEPHRSLLEQLQDRLTQKELLQKFAIPTADFGAWNHDMAPQELFKKFKSGFVLKKRRFGYDGYGTFIFKPGHAPQVPKDENGFIVESLIPFRRELAFSLARNEKKQFAVFPLVETKQIDSRCLWVKGPIKHKMFNKMADQFKRLMNKIDYRGILAVELFETKDGRLLVNELAPRVHNSAHYSLNALSLNQFEAHLRGVLGQPLKNPEPLSKGFAMVNLLGEGGTTKLSNVPLGWLHWYEKSENRPGRKLGHITVTGTSPEAALKTALRWRKGFQL